MSNNNCNKHHNYCSCCGDESHDILEDVIVDGKLQVETDIEVNLDNTNVVNALNTINTTIASLCDATDYSSQINDLKNQIDDLEESTTTALDTKVDKTYAEETYAKKEDIVECLKGASAVVNVIDPETIAVNANQKVTISTTGTLALATSNTSDTITDVSTVVSKDDDNHLIFKEFQPEIQANAFSVNVDIAPLFGGAGTATVVFELYSLASASVVRSNVLTVTSSFPTGYTALPHTIQFFPVADVNSYAQGYELRVVSDSQITYAVKKIVRNTIAQ